MRREAQFRERQEAAAAREAKQKHETARQRDGFLLVTPGIRLAGDEAGDQRRIVPPESAVADGATHLVVGRSITAADDPAKTAADIRASLDAHASG